MTSPTYGLPAAGETHPFYTLAERAGEIGSACPSAVEEAVHSVYGGTQAAFGIAQLLNYPLSGTPLGVAQTLLSNSPYIALAVTTLNIVNCSVGLTRNAFEHKENNGEMLDHPVAFIGNTAFLGSMPFPGDVSYTAAQATASSFGVFAGSFLILAATNFVTALRRYDEALQIMENFKREDNNLLSKNAQANLTKAKSDFGLATVNLMGWLLIAAATYIPALATAAPALLAIGGTLVVLGGFYALGSTVKDCYKAGGIFKFFSQQSALAEWKKQEVEMNARDYKLFAFARPSAAKP